MNCPYCGKPMEAGRILGRRDFGHVWLPEEASTPLAISRKIVENKKGIVLNDPAILRPGVDAYICKSCKKGIFELP